MFKKSTLVFLGVVFFVLGGVTALEGQQTPDYLYWSSNWGSLPLSGNMLRFDSLTRTPDPTFSIPGYGPLGIAVNSTHVYWANFLGDDGSFRQGRSIGRAKLDGSEFNEHFITGCPASPYGVALNDTYLFWVNTDLENSIGKAKLDGTDIDQFFIDLPNWESPDWGIDRAIRGIAVAGDYIYWTDCGKDSIGRAKIDYKTNPISVIEIDEDFIICPQLSQPHPIAVSDNYIFWAEIGESDVSKQVIKRANLAGFDITQIIASTSALAVRGNYLYWGNSIFIDRIDQDFSSGSYEPYWYCTASGAVYGLAFAPDVINVAIDIKPGTFPNMINLGSNGVIPVAILSSSIFDATTVDPSTVTLAGAIVKVKGNGYPIASFQDVNNDGRVDIVVQVGTSALELSATDTDAVLTGKTYSGRSIKGQDTVRIIK